MSAEALFFYQTYVKIVTVTKAGFILSFKHRGSHRTAILIIG